MFKKIKTLVLSLALPVAMLAPLALAPAASADVGDSCSQYGNNITGGLSQGVNNATSGTASCGSVEDQGANLAEVATKIVNLLSWLIGIVAVVMIIFGGFKYITSGGDSSKVGSAKNTLIYAIVGLVIVALAQFIVHFVLTNATGAAS